LKKVLASAGSRDCSFAGKRKRLRFLKILIRVRRDDVIPPAVIRPAAHAAGGSGRDGLPQRTSGL
jgi:hypothetical protein